MRIRGLLRVPGKIPEARPEVVEAIQRMDGGVSRRSLRGFVRMHVAPGERERKKPSLGNTLRNASSGFRCHKTGADRVSYQPCHIVDIQPVHKFAAMRIHGLHAQLQFIGDVFRRTSFGNELQNFALSRCQVGNWVHLLLSVRQIILDQVLGNARA